MTLVSWHDGVTGGFYGRLVGHVGILGAALILVVPVVLLIVIGWRLSGPGAAPDTAEGTAGALA